MSRKPKKPAKVEEPPKIRSSHPPVHTRPLWFSKATAESLRDMLLYLCQSHDLNPDCHGRMERVIEGLEAILRDFKEGITHLKELEASAMSNAYYLNGEDAIPKESYPSGQRPFAKSKSKLNKEIASADAKEVRELIDRNYRKKP